MMLFDFFPVRKTKTINTQEGEKKKMKQSGSSYLSPHDGKLAAAVHAPNRVRIWDLPNVRGKKKGISKESWLNCAAGKKKNEHDERHTHTGAL
jgi:hypothetical protein